MIYAYLRCSTNEEKQDIKRQEREVKKLVKGEKIDFIFSEYESGTKADREELNKLLSMVKEGDTIVATEVSRISRSTKQLCDIIEKAKELKLRLIFGTTVVDCTKELDPMTEGMLKMMAVFSEMERNMISARVKSGLENARAKGKKIGRPAITKEELPKKFLREYPKYLKGEVSKAGLSRLIQLSRPTVDKYIKIMEEI